MTKKNLKCNLLGILFSGLFLIAIQSVNSVSKRNMYQDKEPNSLKKFEKY